MKKNLKIFISIILFIIITISSIPINVYAKALNDEEVIDIDPYAGYNTEVIDDGHNYYEKTAEGNVIVHNLNPVWHIDWMKRRNIINLDAFEKIEKNSYYILTLFGCIRNTPSTVSKENIIAFASENTVVYLIEQLNSKWSYIELISQDNKIIRGYILNSNISNDYNSTRVLKQNITVYDNAKIDDAFFDIKKTTIDSLIVNEPLSATRQNLLNNAIQCLGNPYVWGGLSLLNGCDCSGFIKTLYQTYAGIELPRCSYDQVTMGIASSLENIKPGDLIFYANENGRVHHVMMCFYKTADNKIFVIHAKGEGSGIVISELEYWRTCYVRTFNELN